MIFKKEDGSPDLVKVLGAFMVITAAYILIDSLRTYVGFIELLLNSYVLSTFISPVLTLLFGIAILIPNERTVRTNGSLAGIALGASFMFRNIRFMEYYGADVSFIISFISFLIGICAIVASTALLFGYSHYSDRIWQTMGVMAAIELYPFYDIYASYLNVLDFVPFFFGNILFIACYAVLILLMFDKSVRIIPVNKRIDRDLGTVKDIIYSGDGTYMVPEDGDSLVRFAEGDGVDGLDIVLHDRRETRILKIRRLAGSVYPIAMVVPTNGRSFMEGFRFDVVACCPMEDGDKIRIYGRDGLFVDILVHGIPEEPRIAGKIRRKKKARGSRSVRGPTHRWSCISSRPHPRSQDRWPMSRVSGCRRRSPCRMRRSRSPRRSSVRPSRRSGRSRIPSLSGRIRGPNP